MAAAGFKLVDPDGAVVAEGYEVFNRYVVSWLGELPGYQTWPSINDAITAHDSENAELEVVWA